MTDSPALDLTDEDTAALSTVAKDVADKAKATFSLTDRLKAVKLATAKVIVFLDLEAVELWQAAERRAEALALQTNQFESGSEAHLLAIEAMTEAEEEVERLRVPAMDSALAIHMRALPQVAFDKVQREGRKRFAGDDGDVPEDKQAAYFEHQNETLFGMVVTRIVAADGSTADFKKATLFKELRAALGLPQFRRVEEAFNLLMFNDRLARAATADPGF